jgi:hypothetical protein
LASGTRFVNHHGQHGCDPSEFLVLAIRVFLCDATFSSEQINGGSGFRGAPPCDSVEPCLVAR